MKNLSVDIHFSKVVHENVLTNHCSNKNYIFCLENLLVLDLSSCVQLMNNFFQDMDVVLCSF